MTPKEKVKELVEKFQSISGHSRFSKGYALICVDEIIKQHDEFGHFGLKKDKSWYWNEVKQEIEKL